MSIHAKISINGMILHVSSDGNPDMIIPFLAEVAEKKAMTFDQMEPLWRKGNRFRNNTSISIVTKKGILSDIKNHLLPAKPMASSDEDSNIDGNNWLYIVDNNTLCCAVALNLPNGAYQAINPFWELSRLGEFAEPIYMQMRKSVSRIERAGIKVLHANQSIWAVYADRPVIEQSQLTNGICLRYAREMFRSASYLASYTNLNIGLARLIHP